MTVSVDRAALGAVLLLAAAAVVWRLVRPALVRAARTGLAGRSADRAGRSERVRHLVTAALNAAVAWYAAGAGGFVLSGRAVAGWAGFVFLMGFPVLLATAVALAVLREFYRRREYEEWARVRRELGQPVAPYVASPARVALGWSLTAAGGFVVLAFGLFAVLVGVTGRGDLGAELDPTGVPAAVWVLVDTMTGYSVAAVAAVYVRYRRRRRQLLGAPAGLAA